MGKMNVKNYVMIRHVCNKDALIRVVYISNIIGQNVLNQSGSFGSYSDTGAKQITFHWLISNDIAQKEMVLNSWIIHHLIMITCTSYEIIFIISLPNLINIAQH